MQFRATRCASGRFAMTYCDYGCTSYGGAANGAVGHGSASKRVSASSSRRSESYILIPVYALPPPIQSRNGVRQSRQHGSVRGCALKAHEVQLPEMVTAAKLSWQPRTESCVVASTALRSVDREIVGRNISEREDSPEIDRDRSSRPYPSMGKAESLDAVERVGRDASGVLTAGMRPKNCMGTRESCQVQA